jgi:uncharacterized protein (DUF362 family)
MKSNSRLSRREFIRSAVAVGAAAAVSAFLQACSRVGLTPTLEGTAAYSDAGISPTDTSKPTQAAASENGEAAAGTQEYSQEQEGTMEATQTSTPTTTAPAGIAQVAFVKTNDRALGVRRAIDLLGINPISGKSVFLKPNFNSADPPPGSTHPDVLRSLVLKLGEMGAGTITIGDRSGMGSTRQVMHKLGVFDLAEELGVDTVVFDELGAEDWVKIQPPDCHWKDGFYFAKPCLEAEALVLTCCLKTHKFGGHFTMSLKNSVGMVAKKVPGERHDYMHELHLSRQQRRKIAEINSAYKPALIVLDGVEAFTTGGPAKGKLVAPEVVIAGTDRIAIDAIGVALLRHYGTTRQVSKGPVFGQEQIARAVELGLGVDDPLKIEFLTPDSESEEFAKEIKSILSAG